MTSVLSSRPCNWITSTVQDEPIRSRLNRLQYVGFLGASVLSARERCYGGSVHYVGKIGIGKVEGGLGVSRASAGASGPSAGEDDSPDDEPQNKSGEGSSDSFREDLERMVGADDSSFSGLDLAALIRNKYGRSYDVQLIKKEFMGRNLLAMNVMWKYREQRSFPLTEEEYILRLDDVANTLKCWGAVSHIRNSLAKLKERPRIGKAVSIFIDMDETGGRSREWIYK